MTNPIKLHILQCGYNRIAPGIIDKKEQHLPHEIVPLSQRLTVPVAAYLIEHPVHGKILLDTGWPREISPHGRYDSSAVRRLLPPHLDRYYRPYLPAGQAIDEQLSVLGLQPSDLDYVLLSHLDPDHVGGVRQLSGAKHILLSQEEYFWSCRYAYSRRQVSSPWANLPYETFWFRGSPYGPLGRSCDLFKDGSVILVSLPGHSKGLFGVLLYCGADYVLLTSDGALCQRSWQQTLLPGCFDPETARKSLVWIAEMSRSSHCIATFCSHDPDTPPQTLFF